MGQAVRLRIAKFVVLPVLLVGGALSAFAAAPYLPRLLAEGYPERQWPAAGHFALVAGQSEAPAFPSSAQTARLVPWAQKLFADSEGTALLAWRAGDFVLEHYADGGDRQTRFNSYSMVKSLVGVLVLRAVSLGLIDNLQQPLNAHLPGIGDEAFGRLPLSDFLFMRSGVRFEPSSPKSVSGDKNFEQVLFNPFGPMVRLHMTGLKEVGPGLTADPVGRGQFDYQNINTAILGAVVEKAFDAPLPDVLSKEIWLPAGAQDAHWRRYGSELPATPYCCLYARSVDWMKAAIFLMRNGPDGGFLRSDLFDLYFGRNVSAAKRRAGTYGPHVKHNVLDRPGETLQGPFSYMFGSGGQTVYMMPQRDLVVVRFGGKMPLLHSTLYSTWRSLEAR